VARRVRATVAAPEGRALRRQPQSPASIYYQYQVVLKPSPTTSRTSISIRCALWASNLKQHDVRFVEDDWESPTLGAWGLGWEVWLDGMEITQFTYFQSGRPRLQPVLGEITYGLERLAMYLQGKENVYDLVWTPGNQLRRRLPPERGRAVEVQLRGERRGVAARSVQGIRVAGEASDRIGAAAPRLTRWC